MAQKKIPPMMGIDNSNEDAALEIKGNSPALFLRDAVNVDFTETGRVQVRPGVALQTNKTFKYLWQSSLHGDCFALLDNAWVKVNPSTWEHDELMPLIGGGPLFHQVINNTIVMSCDSGLYEYNGKLASPLTIPTPAKPYVMLTDTSGSILLGDYSFAISWLIDGKESALSESDFISCSGNNCIDIQFPYCMDQRITHVRLYMTESGGGQLQQVEDYPVSLPNLNLTMVPNMGRAASFQYLSPMKHGSFLKLWRGRLVCVQSNVLYFSEPMTFHLTDERYNFIQLPQRITFVEPVDGGLWVGQYDHVVFLRGSDLRELVVEHKASAKPIAHSSFTVESDVVGGELSQGGSLTAMWLAENGFVVGTASGQLVEIQSDHLSNITAQSGTAVRLDNKVMAIVH